ncbi:MAG TPA: hypothetical protein VE132_02505, partial [Micromonosporaceae bacterium]|nr:hypothetical protein [Micromonosporaceae bacterium]
DSMGYHRSVVEPTIASAQNPARAGTFAKLSTIVATAEVGHIYNGGASDIGYAISVNGGQSWNHGELPLTVQGGQSTTCAGALTRGGDSSVAYDAKHDIWLASTTGYAGNAAVQGILLDRGTVNFSTKDIEWGTPICQHVVQGTQDVPDLPWLTCDNWPASKGFGNCYVVYDNNGNGNRALVEVSSDAGLTWTQSANAVPDNGNTGDVSGETTLASMFGSGKSANAGDTNIKVASVNGIGTTLAAAAAAGDQNIKTASVTPFFTTTLSAPSSAGDTNIKVASVAAMAAGQTIDIDTGAAFESAVIQSVGTAGGTGTGVTLTAPLSNAHASGIPVTPAGQQVTVDTGAGVETATIRTVGTAGATGTGVTLTVPLASAHAAGAQVNDREIDVDVDQSGGNQETVTVTNVGTAGATGTGIDFAPALVRDHVTGAHVASITAPQTGHTGDIGAVPLVQPPPPGSDPGSVCGRLVIPTASSGLSWWTSNDCGQHFSAETQILPNFTATHAVAQGLRTSLLPTSTMDGAGNVYLVWQTRSFRVGSVSSTPNDIAMAVMPAPTDADPNPAFGEPARIPIEVDDTTANPVDHFTPSIAADLDTAGTAAHLGLYFYSYPLASCAYVDPANPSDQCDLRLGYVSSIDGGATWSSPNYLADMPLPSLVRTIQGPMIADHMNATVIPAGGSAGNAIVAAPVGIPGGTLQENLYVPTHGLPILGP